MLSLTWHSVVGHASRILSVIIIAVGVMPVRGAVAADIATQTVSIGQSLRGRFVQERYLAGFSKPLRSEGTFVLVPGTGLIWRGEKPFANTTILSPDGILQIANHREAMRISGARVPGLRHLYETLGAAVSGDIKPLKQTFNVIQQSSGAGWKITLVPLNPDNPAMAQLKSLVLAGARFVDSVEIDKGGGDRDLITFLEQTLENGNLSAEEKSLFAALRK